MNEQTSPRLTLEFVLTSTTKTASRMFFADNLRSTVIILVVLHHLSIIYGANASFYYVEPHDTLATEVLGLFQLLNQAWFMGALFLISGYFTPGSFDHKGPGHFIKERLLRLGIPLVFFFFVLNPVASIGIYQMPVSLTKITTPLTWQDYPHLLGIGPMWFVAMLLVFDFGYALWRLAARNRTEKPSTGPTMPGFIPIAVFVIILAISSYLIRIPLPLGKYALGFPSLAYLPQYLSFFILGTIATRGNWLRTISSSMGKWGIWAALLATIVLFPLSLIGLSGSSAPFLGEGQWQSAVYALWDSIFSIGMCLALITFFRRFFDRQGKLGSFLSQQSFTVYIIHAPIIVFLAISIRSIDLENLLKFGIAAVIGIPLCFAVAYLVRKIPYASRIL